MIKLNSQQEKAARFYEGVASVVAVPGSGKTLTMTHRIAHLVNHHRVAPESILGLTFTRNAAYAMRAKLKEALLEASGKVNLMTIHSFCHHLLKEEGINFEILHGAEQVRFMRKIIKKKKIRHISPGAVLQEISLAKNNLIVEEEFSAMHKGDDLMETYAAVYQAYEAEKRKSFRMDFNDLLIQAKEVLRNNPEVRERCIRTYKHILVDEFQDTNPAQLAVLSHLAGGLCRDGASFWICGDDWQSIYSFAGSSPGNILNFKKVYPKSRQFILETNYRSTPEILKVCENLINKNNRRIEKRLITTNPKGEDVRIIEASTEEDEALQIINEIRDLTGQRGYTHKDIAILFRANSQSRVIEEALSRHKIPYHIENGMNFYKRPEVKTILDYMRLIHDPLSESGDEAFRSMINTPNRYIGKKFMEDLEAHTREHDLYLYEGLKTLKIEVPYLRRNVNIFIRMMDPLIQNVSGISPVEMIQILREALDYDRFVTEDEVTGPDDSRIANINQLQMASGKHDTISSLLRYADTFQNPSSSDENGVSLMTIHKSKGLEFPVVFVTGFVDGVLPNRCGETEEERRVAFVGLSRAMKLLYVSYAKSSMGRKVKKSPFLDEMMGL